MQKTTGTSRLLVASALTMLAGVTLAACANDTNDEETDAASVVVELNNNQDRSIGQVELTFPDEERTELTVSAENLAPGFYGFHIHEIGECEPESQDPDDPSATGDFLSAGGHIQGEDGAEHPEHAGDLPTLLVNEDGSAEMSVITDRLDEAQLMDFDGSAVMIHGAPDNFANIPDRYLDTGTDPDEDTVATGDAGDRIGCGVIEGVVDES